MKKYTRRIIVFMLFASLLFIDCAAVPGPPEGGGNGSERDDNVPYLSDEDIAAIETALPDDPVEVPETAALNTELLEDGGNGSEGDENIPYLSDEDIAAIETALPDDPVEIPEPETADPIAGSSEDNKGAEIQADETARLNSSRPVYHLLILDRRNSPLNSDINAGGMAVVYKFKHGASGFLIVLYKSPEEGPVFPVLPDKSRIVADVASAYKSAVRDYINSSTFRRYVTSRKVTAALLAALAGNI